MVGKGIGRLTKGKFSEILGTLWSTSMKRDNTVSGFVSTGLFPHDKTKFPESEFDPIDLKNYYANLHYDNSEENNAALNNELNLETNDTVNPNIEEPMHSLLSINLQASSSGISQEVSFSNDIKNTSSNSFSPTDIIGIFSNQLLQYKQQNPSTTDVAKTPIPRLKTARYGEVLTTTEVLNRLKGAQEKKNMKKPAGKRGRPKKPIDHNSGTTVETSSEEEPEQCNLSISSNDFNDDPLDVEEVVYQRPEWSLIQPGVYILVDFLGGPRNKHHYKYVCCVVSADDDDGEIIVKGMKKENDEGDEFSVVDNDMSTIDMEMIQAILLVSTVAKKGRKLVYKFPGFVTVNEK